VCELDSTHMNGLTDDKKRSVIVAWPVCLSVSHRSMNCARLVEVQFWGCGLVGPKEPMNHILGGAPIPSHRKMICGGHTWACSDLPVINILDLIRQRAAAMQPVAISLL